MRLTCTKYPELLVKGKGYAVRFKGGVAEVTDRKAVAAMKKYVESDAAVKHGVVAVDEPKPAPESQKTEGKPEGKKDEGKPEGKKDEGGADGKAEGGGE